MEINFNKIHILLSNIASFFKNNALINKIKEIAHSVFSNSFQTQVDDSGPLKNVRGELLSRYELIPNGYQPEGEAMHEYKHVFEAMNLQSILRNRPEFFDNATIDMQKIETIQLTYPEKKNTGGTKNDKLNASNDIDFIRANHYLRSILDHVSLNVPIFHEKYAPGTSYNSFNDFVFSDKVYEIAQDKIISANCYIRKTSKDEIKNEPQDFLPYITYDSSMPKIKTNQ